MANIPTQNNNPGDIKDSNTGTFKKFKSPQEGFLNLKNDLKAKIAGNTSTGLTGKSTLKDFAYKWAPPTDNNDSEGYANKLAKKLGVTKDTPIGSLSNRLDDFASAIADNEGYKGQKVLGTSESIAPLQEETGGKLSTEDFAAKIKEKYPQYKSVDDKELTQKITAKYPQYKDSVESTPTATGYDNTAYLGNTDGNTPPPSASTTEFGKASQDLGKGNYAGALGHGVLGIGGKVEGLLNDISSPFASLAAIPVQAGVKAYNKLTGSHVEDPYKNGIGENMDNTKGVSVSPLTVKDKAKDLGNAALTAGTSIIGGVAGNILKGGSVLAKPALEEVLPVSSKVFRAMSSAQKLNLLDDTMKLSDTSASAKLLIQKAISEVTPLAEKELGLTPGLLQKAVGKTGSLIKKGAKGLVGAGVAGALGGTAKGIYDHYTR